MRLRLSGSLPDVSELNDHGVTGWSHDVRVEETFTQLAPKKRPSNKRIWIRKGVLGLVFLLAGALTARATKLSVVAF